MDWQHEYAQRMGGVGSSAIRNLLKTTQYSDIISFAGGFPAPELFPVKKIKKASDHVLKHYHERALQYAPTEGYDPLREFIVHQMAADGIQASVENILITSGSQQSLDLAGRILLNPGDRVVTERPTFIGAIQTWRAYQAELVSTPVDENGIIPDQLEGILRPKPKIVYLMPNFQNPTGVSLSTERREAILGMPEQFAILEDDPYRDLRFEGDDIPPLIKIESKKASRPSPQGETGGIDFGRVIYLGTFSKILAPGLRIGWMAGPSEFIHKCALAKQGIDLQTSTFVQMITYEVIKDGYLSEHIQMVRKEYLDRRDIMLESMERHFPADFSWSIPQGGLFLWVTMPKEMDASVILPKALENKVAFVPGSAFYPNAELKNTFRLNFSNNSPKYIESGIKRLAKVLINT